jgi:hypothetical protein
MFKKRLSGFIIFLLVFFVYVINISAQANFTDLVEEHWGYNAVMSLVKDETISGFEDGTFRPDDTVSRAQFVKMIGKSETRREIDYNDVSQEHWGYDYIMYSGLKSEGNSFMPDVPITRHDVIELIWQRSGAQESIIAPKIITDQGSNKDAVAWGYVYGLILGDDGINLRLDDVLSRAEAAVLIIRARGITSDTPKNNFVDIVKPELFERIYNSLNLFNDISYEPNRTITNGEMARAAIRLGSEEYTLTYSGIMVKTTFEHPYARDVFVLGNSLLGEDVINDSFADKEAITKDALAALTYNIIRKAHKPQSYGPKNNYYSDIKEVNSDMMNTCLTYAYNNGVHLYSDGVIKSDKTITLKEFAALLLQLDYLVGTQSAYTTQQEYYGRVLYDNKLEKNLNKYPDNYENFQCILQDLPIEVYTTDFEGTEKDAVPKHLFDFAREYNLVLVTMLDGYKRQIEKNHDVELHITYYPSLVYNNGNGFTLRAKIEILKTKSGLLVKDVFNESDKIDNNLMLYPGMEFYADIITGQPVKDIKIPYDKVQLEQIITTVK